MSLFPWRVSLLPWVPLPSFLLWKPNFFLSPFLLKHVAYAWESPSFGLWIFHFDMSLDYSWVKFVLNSSNFRTSFLAHIPVTNECHKSCRPLSVVVTNSFSEMTSSIDLLIEISHEIWGYCIIPCHSNITMFILQTHKLTNIVDSEQAS